MSKRTTLIRRKPTQGTRIGRRTSQTRRTVREASCMNPDTSHTTRNSGKNNMMQNSSLSSNS